MNQHILEKLQIVSAIVPINLAAGANNGDWVSMKGYGRCAIVLFKGAGNAAEDPTITVEQAVNVSGGSNKALAFTRVDHKVGTLTAVGQFTTVTQAAANTYQNASSGDAQAIIVIDIKAEDLDADNGFDCVQVSVADVGSVSQIGCALYLLHEPRYGSVPLPSAIAN